MSDTHEIAKALGFSSIKQMNDHRKWLDRQKLQDELIRKKGRTAGAIIDVRDILEETMCETDANNTTLERENI
ncbi:MAG: hypothetical protein ACHQ0Y_04895 [Thermodesulfovibrionales bacterium]